MQLEIGLLVVLAFSQNSDLHINLKRKSIQHCKIEFNLGGLIDIFRTLHRPPHSVHLS